MSRVAVVAGASGGIGMAITDQLKNHGYLVARLSRAITEEQSNTTLSVKCDVTSRESVFAAIGKVIAHFGKIDLFVNSVGIAQAKKIEALNEEDINKLFRTNVIGALWLYQAVVEKMKKQGGGYIIHIGSLRADTPGIAKAGYCTSKAATTQLTRVLAKECREFGVRVTTIHPGYVDTRLYKGISQKIPFRGVFKDTALAIKYFADVVEAEDIGKLVVCLDSFSETTCVEEIRMGHIWGS
jgi:meso-butanediol dehydrogenase/(S,S)-butanediol dehydrogenase/diacetyl reductase